MAVLALEGRRTAHLSHLCRLDHPSNAVLRLHLQVTASVNADVFLVFLVRVAEVSTQSGS